MRQWRLAAAGPRAARCESKSTAASSAISNATAAATFVGRVHDAGSVRVSGRRLLLKWRLAAARPRATRCESESTATCVATTNSAATFVRRLYDVGSVRLTRRRHVHQRRLAAAGTHHSRRGRHSAGIKRGMKRSR